MADWGRTALAATQGSLISCGTATSAWPWPSSGCPDRALALAPLPSRGAAWRRIGTTSRPRHAGRGGGASREVHGLDAVPDDAGVCDVYQATPWCCSGGQSMLVREAFIGTAGPPA